MRISLNQTHSGPPAYHLKMMKTKKPEWAGVKGSAKKRLGSRIQKFARNPLAGLDPMPEASQKVADG
jgi:hypothetical protein